MFAVLERLEMPKIQSRGTIIEWAEMIFVMEKRHAKALKTMFGKLLEGKRIITLGIPDDFEFMDAKLIEILQAKVTPYLEPYQQETA